MLRFVTVMAVLVLPLLSGVIRASAQEHSYRVVATYGDTREVTCLQRDGEVSWVGSLGGGVVRAAGGERERLDTTRGLPGMRVHDCALHEHTLWVATEGGLARWDAASEHFELLARGRFAHVVSCGAREVLSVDAHGRVQRWTGAVATELLHGELVPSALACSADDAHWALGTLNGEVVQDGRPAQRQPAANGGGHVEPVEALRFEHGTRETLIVQTTDHVLRVDLEGQVVSNAPPPARQPKLTTLASPLELGTSTPCGERISALTVHRDALWIGSFDRGLCRYDGATFTHFGGPSVLPSDMVNDLASDGERLYVATARGLAVLEADGTFHSYVHSDCVDQLANACPWYPAVNGVAVDAKLGTAWVADLGALHRVTRASDGAARWKHRADSSFGTRSFTRIAARDGRVAAGSGDAGVLLAKDGERATFTRLDHQSGLADDWVMDLAFDAHGALWVATCTRGVSVHDTHGHMRTLTADDGLADDYTLSVNELDGVIWVGTLRGVSLVRGDRIETLGLADGLSGEEVHDAASFQGQVWLATDAGLSVLAPSDGAQASSYHP